MSYICIYKYSKREPFPCSINYSGERILERKYSDIREQYNALIYHVTRKKWLCLLSQYRSVCREIIDELCIQIIYTNFCNYVTRNSQLWSGNTFHCYPISEEWRFISMPINTFTSAQT